MQSYIRVYSWAKKVTLAAHTQCLPNKPWSYLFLTPFFSFYKSLLKVYAGVLISFFFPQRAIHARRGVLVPPPPWQILETQKHSHTTSPALSPASRFFWGGFKKETENLSQLVSERSSSIHHNNHYSRRVKSSKKDASARTDGEKKKSWARVSHKVIGCISTHTHTNESRNPSPTTRKWVCFSGCRRIPSKLQDVEEHSTVSRDIRLLNITFGSDYFAFEMVVVVVGGKTKRASAPRKVYQSLTTGYTTYIFITNFRSARLVGRSGRFFNIQTSQPIFHTNKTRGSF